jgi:hypothetical protein
VDTLVGMSKIADKLHWHWWPVAPERVRALG